MIWQPFITHELLVGIGLKNLVASLVWDTAAKDSQGFKTDLGLSYRPIGWPVSLALGFTFMERWRDMPLCVATEGWVYDNRVGVRLGWNDQVLACGASYKSEGGYRLDYSFSYHSSYLEDNHALDLSFSF